MKAQFAPYSPMYVSNLILFPTEIALANAINAVENYANTNGLVMDKNVSLLDMGKKLYLGLLKGNSSLFTYTLVQSTSATLNNLTTYYVLTASGPLSPFMNAALAGAGMVDVGASA